MRYSEKRMSRTKEEQIIKDIKEDMGDWYKWFKDSNSHYREMIPFINGNQWDSKTSSDYNSMHKPIVTVNKLKPYFLQLDGEDKTNTPQVYLRKIGISEEQDEKKMEASVYEHRLADNTPQGQDQQPQQQQSNVVTDVTKLIKMTPLYVEDPKIKILEGLIRNIAYNSSSEEIYDWARKCAREGGYGAYRICSGYQESRNIYQSIYLKKITDPTKAYWDPGAQELCKTDGDYGGVLSTMSRKRFEKEFPGVEYPHSFTPIDEDLDSAVFWGDQDIITIAEHYRKEYFNDTAFLLDDGLIVYESEIDEREAEKYSKSKKIYKHKFKNYHIYHYKLIDNQILEKTLSPFKKIPIPFVDGDSFYSVQKQFTQSLAKSCVDAQRSINYVASDIQYWMKLAKKNQWVVPVEIIPPELQKWWNQTDNPAAYLPYSGREALKVQAKPEMVAPPAVPTYLFEQYSRLENDIKTTLGRYESNIGAPGDAISGRAESFRAMQGNSTLNPYRKNSLEAIEEGGKIILDAISKIYDEERVVTILGRDGETQEVPINKSNFNYKNLEWERNIDMTNLGDWEIKVDVGASYPIQKQMDVENAIKLISMDPTGQAYSLLAPYIAEDFETPKSKDMAARLTFLVPPQILAAEQGKKFLPPPNPVQQMQLQSAQLDLTQKQADIKKTTVETMTDQMNAVSNMIKAKSGADKTKSEAILAPQKLQAEVIRAGADMQDNENKHNREMVKILHNKIL